MRGQLHTGVAEDSPPAISRTSRIDGSAVSPQRDRGGYNIVGAPSGSSGRVLPDQGFLP